MTLHEHINSFPRHLRTGIRNDLAQAAGVSEPAVRHWANGTRKVHPNKVLDLENATGGSVTRHDLRPDIFGPLP
ncbi:MAG: helix-turn-helix domain-containing protein [Magnetococcales bacterium]|nr:helix-turn-helix domain-containing protein [Magnetococcales bacterium]